MRKCVAKAKGENISKTYKRPNFLESILINDYRVLFGEELMLKVQKIHFTEKKISSFPTKKMTRAAACE